MDWALRNPAAEIGTMQSSSPVTSRLAEHMYYGKIVTVEGKR
jgi:hypothetical protein